MENAVQALKMAAAVLVFIIAIASSFSLFGTAKQTADSIITMRDKQAYLDAAELDNGILYTSSSAIQGDTTDLTEEEIASQRKEVSTITGVTKGGDRIVAVEDVVSTILRYNKEKYGVTIVTENGYVIARFDSNTEALMTIWNQKVKDEYGNLIDSVSEENKEKYVEQLKNNTYTEYITSQYPDFSEAVLENLYEITGSRLKCGAPWYGNEDEIQRRIASDLAETSYTYNGQTYQGKGLLNKLKGGTIVEVTNEIDKSTYLKDGETTTDLLQQFELPTIEIVYIIL